MLRYDQADRLAACSLRHLLPDMVVSETILYGYRRLGEREREAVWALRCIAGEESSGKSWTGGRVA